MFQGQLLLISSKFKCFNTYCLNIFFTFALLFDRWLKSDTHQQVSDRLQNVFLSLPMNESLNFHQ